jgi:hypothetical protein
MSEQLVLRIEELRDAIDRTLVAAQERLGPDVTLTDDYYWHLPLDAAFDMTTEPSTLTAGQLSDDLEHLRDAADVEPGTVWHDLAHLIGLLRALERLATS